MTKPSCDQLLDEAVRWLASKIDSARERAREAAHPPSPPQREKGLLRKVAGTLLGASQEEGRARPQRIDQWAARDEGKRWLKSGAEDPGGADAVGDLAAALCLRWKHPNSAPLARAWLAESKLDVETLMDMDGRTLALIVGVAAAAAVLALVIVVRRGRTISIGRREFAPSPDFRALMILAEGEGEAAAIAARIRSEVAEPWSWGLTEALRGLAPAAKRTLLGALAERNLCGVSAFSPEAGDDFDSSRMSPAGSITTDDLWVVASDTSDDRRGYRVADRVEVPAEVEVCTADWWVLSRAGCAVGEAIVERADNLIAGGRAKAASWRAPWGFTFPEDLRGLPETLLDGWRQRLIAELNPRYRDRPERQLVLVGHPGEAFESSMETEDGRSPVGDAVVSEVVLRDGVPQYGLACPGGSPLLLAVVRTSPARSGA
ncbi:hypothetical protein [Corallococcus exercitus]|uniref:hypothetical protein n=1 Tax=Corallococcus exercitus TaxID=2316736 RepID=UPI0035D4A019